ncbi:MAG: PLP-dependent aminotransferase family protein [Acidobacteriaceae bacterium]
MSTINSLNMEKLLSRRASQLSVAASAPAPAHPISFDSGHAFPAVLPDLTAEAEVALQAYRPETLQYAPRPGLSDLREWIADYMHKDGIRNVSADEVLVTNGAKHALELVCRVLLDEGDAIVVTSPTYFTAIPIFRSFGVEFIEIQQDSEGLDVGELEQVLARRKRDGKRLPKFIYDVPDFHNPTGVTMSLKRRESLLALAEANGIFVVEDSPYRRVIFEGELQPSLKALDRADIVFLLGTFSKIMAPGLRIGWVHCSRGMVQRMIQLKTDGGSCPLTQRMIVEFCRAGRLPAHIEKVQGVYRDHRDRMVSAVRRELPDARMSVPQGGYYVWLTFPRGADGDKLAGLAAKENVVLIPGSRFYAVNGGRPPGEASPKNQIRLAYSHATFDEIDEGVKRIGQIYLSLHG